MRIAVPTNDGESISGHFGRSAAFLVFEVEAGEIKSRELRPNAAPCGDAAGGHAHHGHTGMVGALAGCNVVICGGIGGRAVEALQAAGVGQVIAGAEGSPGAAVDAYLKGTLDMSGQSFCRCSH